MIKALKVVLIIYGVLMILTGLLEITMHDLVAEMYGFGEVPSYVNWMGEIIGAVFIAIGVWVIVAGRDPLRHINWVKFVITMSLLAVAVGVHSIIVGYVTFSQIAGQIIFDGIFAVALLALYPWRTARSDE
jgi:hypothetical protein